jgi:hypothetical protein
MLWIVKKIRVRVFKWSKKLIDIITWGVGGVAAGILSTVAVFSLVFPTKDRINQQSSACRAELYKEINELKKQLSNKADNTAFTALSTQINEINKNLIELATTVKMMLKQGN